MNWTWAGIITAACILIAAVIGYNRGFIKEAVSTLLLFLSILMVWFINPYVNQFLRENTPLYTTLSEGSAKAVSGVIESGVKVSREEQGKLIDSLPLPKMLKEKGAGKAKAESGAGEGKEAAVAAKEGAAESKNVLQRFDREIQQAGELCFPGAKPAGGRTGQRKQ